jgi:hypothetical protein
MNVADVVVVTVLRGRGRMDELIVSSELGVEAVAEAVAVAAAELRGWSPTSRHETPRFSTRVLDSLFSKYIFPLYQQYTHKHLLYSCSIYMVH